MEQARVRQTEMPRAAMPRDSSRSEAIVWGVAFGLAAIFAAGQILTVLAAAPAAIAFHTQTEAVPWLVRIAESIGPTGIFLGLAAVDGAILALCAWLARRYWVGFIYLPPVLYLGFGIVVLWLLLANAVLWVLRT
jgi:hypothetical protein